MATEGPLFSVIVAVLNGASTLQRCLDSVFAQDVDSWELLIQDGGSTDGSLDILRKNSSRIAYWASGADTSLYDAFNKALARARGEWIYFLGADDYLWNATVFRRLTPVLKDAFPPYRIVYGRAAFVSEQGRILEHLGEPWKPFKKYFVCGKMLPHQAVMHHRTLFSERGVFDARFKVGGDYEMLLRELLQKDPLFVPEIVVAGYQFGGDSSKPANAFKVLKAVRVAQRMHGISRPSVLWTVWWARACLRIAIWTVLGETLAKKLVDLGRAVLGKRPFWTRT